MNKKNRCGVDFRDAAVPGKLFIIFFLALVDVFEEYYIFAIIMDLFQTSFLAPCILNTPC